MNAGLLVRGFVLQQLANPGTVLFIRLVTRNVLDVTSINYPNLERCGLKNLVHRFPINTGTLHRYVGNALFQ